jgi:hypothetical protein
MRRFLFSAVFAVVITNGTAAILGLAACNSTSDDAVSPFEDDAGPHRDSGLVAPAEAGTYDGGVPQGPAPECGKYCDLVMASCTNEHAQYASRDECLEICAHLPAGDAGDITSNSVACRQYFAGSPARTDAKSYCFAAGPFGGGVCGPDRCISFCMLTLDACSPDAGPGAPYASYSDCQTACAGYAYKDDADGGGELPDGPISGDTLNCRLFYVRSAVHDGSGCADLGTDGGACK